MPGETILVVEDSPVGLKLVATMLRESGYKVQIASTAEQAWSILRYFKPQLILVDLFLPGMSGLELTHQVKKDPRLADVTVVALTGAIMKDDEERARAAGCDGYLRKPVDGPTLVESVGGYLGRRVCEAPAPAAQDAVAVLPAEPAPDPFSFGLPEPEMEDLRRTFLAHGTVQVQQLLAHLHSGFELTEACRAAHQWSGAGGLLGFRQISELSRRVEALLRTPALNHASLRDPLEKLALAFSESGAITQETAVPESLARELRGKRVALVGMADWEAEQLCSALEGVGAKPRKFGAQDSAEQESVRVCDILVVHVRPETLGCSWLVPKFVPAPQIPLVYLGARSILLSLDAAVRARAAEWLIDGWQSEEALMRLSFALARPTAARAAYPGRSADTRASANSAPGGSVVAGEAIDTELRTAVLADDDDIVRRVIEGTLETHGWRCRLAADGIEALELIREHRPHAAVLDVNMPGIDGFEVLAAVRAEAIPVRVILLTARHEESDILRGFSLGSDDYMVKPFSPMELVARLTRLKANA